MASATNYQAALSAAIDRDIRDTERLDHFVDVLTVALDKILYDIDKLEHPEARWHPADLIDCLQGQLKDIRHERQRINTGSPVLDE